MTFLPNYIDKLTQFDRARYDLKVGCDPYELVWDDLSEKTEYWPLVTDYDRIDYLLTRTNFASKEAIKNYKSLEAHNFFTNGLVFRPRVKTLPDNRVILLGKVHHSQRHTQEPLRLWILANLNGEVVTGHCNCMAGRCETCSHVAATIFMLEFAAKAEENVTCTGKQNVWLPPTMISVPHKEVRDIDFSSASAKLKRVEAAVAVG